MRHKAQFGHPGVRIGPLPIAYSVSARGHLESAGEDTAASEAARTIADCDAAARSARTYHFDCRIVVNPPLKNLRRTSQSKRFACKRATIWADAQPRHGSRRRLARPATETHRMFPMKVHTAQLRPARSTAPLPEPLEPCAPAPCPHRPRLRRRLSRVLWHRRCPQYR